MLFNNIQTINDWLQKIEKIMSDKLPKLDVLDVINKKFENFEKSIHGKLQSHSMKYNLILGGILQRANDKSLYRLFC